MGKADTRVVTTQGRMSRPPSERSRGSVQSVERTLLLFERVVRSNQDLGLRELAEAVDLPVGTTHRLLSALTQRGYLRQDAGSRRYGPGATALDLAARIVRRDSLEVRSQPYLRELVRLTGESANLARLDGTQVVYVAQAASPRMVRMFTEVGNRAPLHATGTGKVLLAFLPEAEREWLIARQPLPAFTTATIVQPATLREELARIRACGYALDDGELEEGVHCVALPVRDSSGQVAAAVSVSGPSNRLTRERVDALLPSIRDVVERFSCADGW